MLTRMLAVFVTECRLLWGPNQVRLRRIIYALSRPIMQSRSGRDFYLFVGFSKSGKRTIIRSDPLLAAAYCVSTDEIHRRLNRMIPWLRDDLTVTGPAYWPRQWLTQKIRQALLDIAFRSGVVVVSDSCNLVQSERRRRLVLAKRHGYRTEIIWIRCRESILLKRLQAADEDKRSRGQRPTWVDLYRQVQRERFQAPELGEADRISGRNGDGVAA